MMKKILFFTFVGLLMALPSSGQTASDTLQQANDSVTIGSHTEFSAAAQENSVTKAEGDSAYVKNDYASAIQIYEALLKEGEAAEVYYNLGNSYYKAGDIAKAILNYERALYLITPSLPLQEREETSSNWIWCCVTISPQRSIRWESIIPMQSCIISKKRISA